MASDATPFPSRPRLHSPALAHDTPPELRVLEGVWRNLRRSAPPESPVTAAPLARDFKGKGREQPPQRSSSAGASTDVVRSTRAARTSWADDNKENAGRSWAKQAGRDPWDKQANRARPAASPGRPSREPLGPSSGRPASANLPPAARSLYEHPRQPADAGPRAAPSRQASTTRTASHASTHKTAGSPPTVRFAGEPPGKATARAPSRNPKRKTSSASSSKRPARGSHVPAVDHKHNKDARPDAAPAAAGPRTVSTSSSTAYQPSHLHARLHDFAHLPPSHAGASYPRFSPPPDEYVLDELSLASSGAESSSAAAGRHPAEHPLATLHLAPSSQALKHGHVSILDGRSNGGACVLLWLRDETWALSDDGQKLCYWSAVASQDSRGLPDRMPGRRWIVPANQPHRAVERDEAKHQRRFRFLADWITAERKRGVIASLHLPPPTFPLGAVLVAHADVPRPSLTLHLPKTSKSATVTAHYCSTARTFTLERRTEGLWTRRVVRADAGDADEAGLEGSEREAWTLVRGCVDGRMGEHAWETVAAG